MLIISCHADTNFEAHLLERLPNEILYGHMDNFVGVHAVMQAYFSGRLHFPYLRIELTYGEEVDFAGALEVLETVKSHDLIVVVDVTGTPTERDFVVEKCRHPAVRAFLQRAWQGLSFDLYEDCPDPVADMDESDVYRRKSEYVFFLGVPLWGGDYNRERVYCKARSIPAIADAICRLAERFPAFCRKEGLPVSGPA